MEGFRQRTRRGIAAMALIGGLAGGTVAASAFGGPASAATTGVTVAGGYGGGSASNQLSLPSDVAVDSSGNVYVADTFNNRVEEWTPDATSGVTVAGSSSGDFGAGANQLWGPSGVAVNAAGDVFVADSNNNRVQEWAPGATNGVTVAGSSSGVAGSGVSQLNDPYGVAVDSLGDVFVLDTNNNRVQEWTPGATSGMTVAGGHGAGPAANQLNFPEGIAVDSSGDVYVADTFNNRVQEWTPGASSGVTVAGSNSGADGSGANQLTNPTGVAVDSSGNVYVADTFNNRVQEWAPGATSGTTVAGGTEGSAADQLSFPDGVAVDSSRNVYVADTGNDRVQEWTATDDDLGITITPPANITVDATSPSGATVSYPAPTVSDPDDATPPTPSCQPVSGSTFPIGSTTVSCSVSDTDDANSPQTTSFQVTVVGPTFQLYELQRSVMGVGPGTSLYDKLGQAQTDLAANDVNDTCALLNAFSNEVNATLPNAAATPLVTAASNIRAVLGCSSLGSSALKRAH
jgi:sugar lactone lactonase YvrE